MTAFDELFHSYNFIEIVNSIISALGYNTLVVLLLAFFAAIVYFSALPSKSLLSSDFRKVSVLTFVNQAFYIFSFLIVLIILKSGWSSLIPFFGLYFVTITPMLINHRSLGRDFTFDDFLEIRNGYIMLLLSDSWKAIRRYGGLALMWIVLLGESWYLLSYNPSIPLLGWIIIFYTLVSAIFQTAIIHGKIIHVQQSPYTRITTTDAKTIDGFIIAKESDYYIVKTKEGEILFPNSQIKNISPIPLSSQ